MPPNSTTKTNTFMCIHQQLCCDVWNLICIIDGFAFRSFEIHFWLLLVAPLLNAEFTVIFQWPWHRQHHICTTHPCHLLPLRHRDESKNDKCNGDCKNVDCQQRHHAQRNYGESRSIDNNNTDQSLCSLNRGEDVTKTTASEDAHNNQISIDSRTKGVCSAPQTHSGPTGPPDTDEHREQRDNTTSMDQTDGEHKSRNSDVTSTSSSGTTATTTASGSGNNSTVSISSCSNKATIQRQKRLRTPVWARSMSSNKTYINISSCYFNSYK